MTQPPDDTELVDVLAPLVHRVLARTGLGEALREDLAQEALSRVLALRHRLDDDALAPYAVVTARHLAISSIRDEHRRRRHAHRLVELGQPLSPEEDVVRAEEHQAVAEALGRLSQRERQALVSHVVDGASTHDLATRLRSTPGAVAALLARARARLRVEHVLALRRMDELPTERCRPILLALSAGDRRRQEALGAGRHLATCPVCADLSFPLVGRDRGLATAWPLLPVSTAGLRLAGQARRHPALSAATGAVAGISLGVAAALSAPAPSPAPGPAAAAAGPTSGPALDPTPGPGPVPSPGQPPAQLIAGGSVLLPGGGHPDLLAHLGQQVMGRDLTVQALAGQVSPGEGADDERFWVSPTQSPPTQEILVFFHIDAEPPFAIRPTDTVSFTGVLRPYRGDTPALGVASTWAPALARQGAYVEVTSVHALTLGPPAGHPPAT